MQIALLRGGLLFRACTAMVGLQGHSGERFGGTCLEDFSLRRACRATRESVFGGVFVFWGGFCVDSCSVAGPQGRAFWRCILGWFLARPKLYHHYGPQGRRSWPQNGSNAAVKQPTWRLDGYFHFTNFGCSCTVWAAERLEYIYVCINTIYIHFLISSSLLPQAPQRSWEAGHGRRRHRIFQLGACAVGAPRCRRPWEPGELGRK